MEELLVRQPQAHEHIARVPQDRTQEELAERLLRLAHVDLVQQEETLMDTKHSVLPIEMQTEEQALRHQSVGERMADVARLSREASQQLADKPESKTSDILKTAKTLAADEAIAANSSGETERATQALESVVAISLLETQYDYDESVIRRVVAKGLAPNLLAALDRTKGLVAVSDTGYGIAGVPGRFAGSANLIRVATNTDFDEQFDNMRPLVPPSRPAKAEAYRSQVIDELGFEDLTALASNALEIKHNPSQAAYLATRALEKIEASSFSSIAEDITKTILVAAECVQHAQDETLQKRYEAALSHYRSVRLAGSEYRQNNEITYKLDITIGRLIVLGREDLAMQLLSSSSREVSHGEETDRFYNLDKLGHMIDEVVEGLDVNEPWDGTKLQSTVRKLHDEKTRQMERELLVNGADEDTIRSILMNALDPDSAAAISSEFWRRYNSMTGADIAMKDRNYSSYYGKAEGVRSLIESNSVRRLDLVAEAITQLLEAGIEPDLIGTGIVRSLDKLRHHDKQQRFIEQLSKVIPLACDEQQPEKGHDANLLNLFLDFEEPQAAMDLAARLYGDAAIENFSTFARFFVSSSSPDNLIIIDDERATRLLLLAETASPYGQKLLASYEGATFIRDQLLQEDVHAEDIKEFLASMNDPVLVRIAETVGGHSLERLILRSMDMQEHAEAISDAFRDVRLGETLDWLTESPFIQKKILGSFIYPEASYEDWGKRISEALREPGLKQLVRDHPLLETTIINNIIQFRFSRERAAEIVSVLNDPTFRQLDEYLDGYVEAGDRAFLSLGDTIINHGQPRERLAQITKLYFEQSEFLQVANIHPQYDLHLDTWIDLFDSIPEGTPGQRMRKQIRSRLALRVRDGFYADRLENDVEGIRIFDEIKPLKEDVEFARELGLELIERLIQADSVRGFPSAKSTKLKDVFYDDALATAYQTLMQLKQAGDVDGIRRFADSLESSPTVSELALSDFTSQLKAAVSDVWKADQAAPVWLNEFSGQRIRSTKFIEAWKARRIALRYGIKDNPNDILDFAAEHGLLLHYNMLLDRKATDVTQAEFDGEQKLVKAMGARYSPSTVFQALEKVVHFEREHGPYPNKILEPRKTRVMSSDREFWAETLAPDDPRGFSIGFDTGCCMTLGGASESCIWAGYEDPRYSFFAVYDSEQRLRAQSVMYIAEQDGKRVLVADNIEATKGTDLSPITDVYRKALLAFVQDTGLEIDAIHIGHGYTPSRVIANLPVAEKSYPSPRPDTYSDSLVQHVLWQKDAV